MSNSLEMVIEISAAACRKCWLIYSVFAGCEIMKINCVVTRPLVCLSE